MQSVMEYRNAGLSFREIGAKVGVNHTYAFRLYREAIDERVAELNVETDKHVAAQIARLESLITTQWAMLPSAQAAGVILQALAAQAKLLGLYAPTRVEHSGEVDVVHESMVERRARIMAETADEFARMSPEELAIEVAHLADA